MSGEILESKNVNNNIGGEGGEEKKVFEYNGKWAYRSPIDNTLFIYDNGSAEWKPEVEEKTQPKKQGNKKQKRTKDEDRAMREEKEYEESTVLYISGLPETNAEKISVDEIHQYFRKAGYVALDENGKPKIIQFIDQDTRLPRGDAILAFERKESIPLAVMQFDETEIKKGYLVKVQKATLEQSQYLKSVHTNSKKMKKDKRKKLQDESRFGWAESESKSVIIKNLFDLEESERDPLFFNDLQADLEDEEHGCAKCGEISSINIFERNPEGVASIKFKEFESAERCVALMDGRFFAGRKLEAFFYDGFTDYHVAETEEQKEERIKKWENYLNQQGGDDGDDDDKNDE